LEFIEVKKAVEEGKLPESQYSRVHPALLGLGLFCCSIIFYPLFMHWRNESKYFKPQPHAVWFAIVILVVSIGISMLLNLGQAVIQAAESGQY
jgi:cobalamin biosynthesis protein CobD/CbiB